MFGTRSRSGFERSLHLLDEPCEGTTARLKGESYVRSPGVIEQLKNGVNALRVPLHDLVSNRAYMMIATLAWNVRSWFAMMLHLKHDRETYICMGFRRFTNTMILIPCRVVRRARSIVVRIIGYQPSLDRLFSVWDAIERTGFA